MDIKQVLFYDDNVPLGGIMLDHKCIICGCCGYEFDVDEIGRENITILPWSNLCPGILSSIDEEGWYEQ